jgi:hypothetical protein
LWIVVDCGLIFVFLFKFIYCTSYIVFELFELFEL